MLHPAVSDYLECLQDLAEIPRIMRESVARAQRLQPNWTPPNDVRTEHIFNDCDVALGLCRSARVFDFSADVYRAAARRTVRDGFDSMPDLAQLPFDVCWFACTEGDDIVSRIDPRLREDQRDQPKISVIVLTRSGALLALSKEDWSGERHSAIRRIIGKSAGWTVVIINLDDEHAHPTAAQFCRSLVLAAQLGSSTKAQPIARSLSLTRALERTRKFTPCVPPELYTVHMDARCAGRAIAVLARPHASPSYRHEVRGHHRLLVRRGRWPNDAEVAFWRRRGYATCRGDALPDDALSPVARRLRHDLRVIVRQQPRPLGSAVIEDTIRDHADLHFAIATIAGKINPKKEIGDLQAWARSVKQQLQQFGELRQAITSATRAFDEDNTIALANGPAEVQGLIDTVFKWRNRSTRRAAPREESG